MGECTYYFKAQFKSATAAKKAFPKIQAFLEESRAAYRFWQNNRGDKTSDKDFWEVFSNYKTVCKYLTCTPVTPGGGRNNELSGKLDFGQEDGDLVIDGAVIGYANIVWHFSEWSYLAEFLKEHFGATRVVVASEEDGCGSLENLSLYDYEAIVTDLVATAKKNRVLYNCLRETGIHIDLALLLDL